MVHFNHYIIYIRVFYAHCIALGIQKHLVAACFGALAGKTLDGWRNDHLAERDAVLRHYVELHPEDFPNQGDK